MLTRAGWVMQDHEPANLYDGEDVAVRELLTNAGPGDHVLFVAFEETLVGVALDVDIEAHPGLAVDQVMYQPLGLTRPGAIGQREETERSKRFSYGELVARDKASLGIFWLCEETLECTDKPPAPGVIAAEIVDDLEAALEEFRALAESLEGVGIDMEGIG